MVRVENLSCGYNTEILKNVSFTGDKGDIICILGANGSGKSTLIKTLVGLVEPYGGEILIENENTKT